MSECLIHHIEDCVICAVRGPKHFAPDLKQINCNHEYESDGGQCIRCGQRGGLLEAKEVKGE